MFTKTFNRNPVKINGIGNLINFLTHLFKKGMVIQYTFTYSKNKTFEYSTSHWPTASFPPATSRPKALLAPLLHTASLTTLTIVCWRQRRYIE